MTDTVITSARSYLYVPGDDSAKLAKAPIRGADALIVDLEDALAPGRQEYARQCTAKAVGAWPVKAAAWIRVPPHSWSDDLRGLPLERIRGVILAKADRTSLTALSAWLAAHAPQVGLAALIETAPALLDVAAMTKVPGVSFVMLGEADLRAELGVRQQSDGRELDTHRHQLVLASAAAGINPPVAPMSADFHDLGSLAASSHRLRDMGFWGRTAIHPAQVRVINDAFSPTLDERNQALDVITRFDQAVAEAKGVAVDAAGRMIDEALVRSARRTLNAFRD